MKRGEIYFITPNQVVTGSEQSGGRPGIIVSNDIGNKYSAVVEVVYTTTQNKRPLPTHVELTATPRRSLALCEQIVTVAKQRVGDYVGRLSIKEMELVDRALAISLGLTTRKEKRSMHEVKIFQNEEFGQIRTMDVDGVPHFVANDVARALGYVNPSKATNDHCKRPTMVWGNDSLGRRQEFKVIPEGDIYRLASKSKLPSAERFESWIFDEVIPSIRKDGFYEMPNMSKEMKAILMHDEKIVNIEDRMNRLEYDIPLYGSEADELSNHVKRKGVAVLGGKDAPAYKNPDIRPKVYRDIYDQMKREFGIYDDAGKPRSYKALKRKYIQDAHGMVDGYEPPKYLRELIEDENMEDQG